MVQRKTRGHGRITKAPATPDSVDERARELALIAGHDPKHPTAADIAQAKMELLGDESADAPVDDPAIMAERLDKRPFSRGGEVRKHLPTDDQTTERTVQEGVEEAEHDEMVEAAKHRTRSEGGQ
ncbi:MAG TPA: hypothetical protein VF988_05775 [Verrucomicrobiae bacterium]